MYPIKIKLWAVPITIALIKHFETILEKKNNPWLFTKFDTDNDIFLWYIWEIAFAKFLYELWYEKENDYLQVNRYINEEKYNEHFTHANWKKYDKYDFYLSIFYDEKNNVVPLKIDIKTQKYTGKYNEEWEFWVNEKTINDIEKDNRKMDYFVFIFSDSEVSDLIDKENISNSWQIDSSILKKNEITLEILWAFDVKKFKNISTVFYRDEIFRINPKDDDIYNFKCLSTMYRIKIKHLENITKFIPRKKINFRKSIIEKYNNLFPKDENSKFFKIVNDNNEECLMQYNKLYLSSQYKSFDDFINKLNTINK